MKGLKSNDPITGQFFLVGSDWRVRIWHACQHACSKIAIGRRAPKALGSSDAWGMLVGLIAPSPHVWPRGSFPELPKSNLGLVSIASVWIPLIIEFAIDRLAFIQGHCLCGNAVRLFHRSTWELGNRFSIRFFLFPLWNLWVRLTSANNTSLDIRKCPIKESIESGSCNAWNDITGVLTRTTFWHQSETWSVYPGDLWFPP